MFYGPSVNLESGDIYNTADPIKAAGDGERTRAFVGYKSAAAGPLLYAVSRVTRSARRALRRQSLSACDHRRTRNRHGHGESDCLIKTKHRDSPGEGSYAM